MLVGWRLLFLVPLLWSVDAVNKSVWLWTGDIFGYPTGGPVNTTKLTHFLDATAALSDVVDTVSPTAFYLADPANATALNITGGLVLKQGSDAVIRGLQGLGKFRVEPLIGTIPKVESLEQLRFYYQGAGRAAFIEACVRAVKRWRLDGLNFDFETPGCTAANNCTTAGDGEMFASLLSEVRAAIRTVNPGARVSVDTGQSDIARSGVLNSSTADLFMDMNSYYDERGFDISVPRDLQADGQARMAVGVCPSCAHSPTDSAGVAARMAKAGRFGVAHVAFWANPYVVNSSCPEALWWREIRKWKSLPLPPLPDAPLNG